MVAAPRGARNAVSVNVREVPVSLLRARNVLSAEVSLIFRLASYAQRRMSSRLLPESFSRRKKQTVMDQRKVVGGSWRVQVFQEASWRTIMRTLSSAS